MSDRYLRTGQRSGRRGLWFALRGIVTAAAAVAIVAVGPGGGEARAQQENLTVDEVLDRVEEARARIESVSYRLAKSTQHHVKPALDRAEEMFPDHVHLTVNVLERGELRRSREHRRQVYSDQASRPEAEMSFAAVANDHAIGIRRGGRTDVWHRVGAVSDEASERFRAFASDYLRKGFGLAGMDLRQFRGFLDRPDSYSYQARVIKREGRDVIEIRPREWDEGHPRGGSLLIVEPDRGYLITHVRFYVRGELTEEHDVEPMVVKDEAGQGDVWFPGRVESTKWYTDEAGERRLRENAIVRFEDVRVNPPVPDDLFSLAVALEWEDHKGTRNDGEPGGHPVDFWDEGRAVERGMYQDGQFVDFYPLVDDGN